MLPDAFEAFCECHQDGMYHVALNILHDWRDAEDAVQSAFVRICNTYQGLTFPTQREERIYALRAVQCAAVDLLRKKRPEVHLNEGIATLSVNSDPTHEAVAVRETIHEADALIRALSPKAQAVFKFRGVGLSDTEVAESLGMTISDVRVTAHRVKRKLRTLLREEEVRDGFGQSGFHGSRQ